MAFQITLLILSIMVLTLSCSIPLQKEAKSVQLVYIQPNKGLCQFIGQTSASDGGIVSGDFMSSTTIHKSTENLMKNKAYSMGGNTVYVEQQFNKNEKLTENMTNQTMIGFIYQCPPYYF